MGPQSLAALHRLQAVETKLRGLNGQLRRKDRQLNQHRLRVKQLEDQLKDRRAEIKSRKTQAAQLELDFRSKEVAVDKLRTQLNVSKNNKEYSLILTQLNTERADNSKLEERILEELTVVEQLQGTLAEMEKTLETQQGEQAEAEKEGESFRQELQVQIDALMAEREQVAEEVAPKDLALFERVADSREGEVMAKILKPGRDQEFICAGCNMTLPMEKVNALLTKEEIQVCNICGCILYVESESDLK
jgi:predicted  nucleic acid-binding Zn-ribbon protein